jgi:predicted alpha/beta-hydrolase family hydrolase
VNKTEILPFADSHRESPVQGYFHVPANPSGDGLVITHGAGSNCQSPILIALASSFADSGLTVLRCDLPFRVSRPHGPPPRGSAERDQQGLRRAIDAMRLRVSGRIYLGGHSYGGRRASILAASDTTLVAALLLLSYPLHPPKRPMELRTTHFPALHTPALFVHGTRDAFATEEELTIALKLIPARTELFTVEDSGHELLTSKNRSRLPAAITAAFTEFCGGCHPMSEPTG